MASSLASQSLHQHSNEQHIVHYTKCPVCGSEQIQPVLQVQDFTVSQQVFEVWHCKNCTFRFTQDVPDASTIGPFYQSSAYVSHSDTQEGLINRLYHLVRNYTLQAKRKLVQRAVGVRSGSLLDVGAGTGAFSAVMQQNGWQITALEPDETARRNAKEKHGLILQSPETLYTLTNETFDAITLWHVLEHVHDLQGYMQTFQRVLKSKGRLLIAVPNYTSYDASLYKAFWAAYDVPRHLYHFSPASVEQLATQHGFSVERHLPMWFDSVYVAMLSEQYKTGKSKSNFLKALYNGILSNLKAIGQPSKCSSVIYVLKKQ